MDRTLRGKNQRFVSSSSVTEPEYDVVDDQEEVLNVRILPARPIDEEYADRDPPRSSSAQSLPSHVSGNNLLSSPRREIPHCVAPAVNRDMKPGRRKFILDKRSITVQREDQHSHSGQEKSTKKEAFSSQATGLHSAENQRHFSDQDTRHIDLRSHHNLETVSSKHQHDEWRQTKRDFDQHDFVPKETPQRVYCEAEWYIGACERADAEHALHLVNKDGAFLVRDCSINTSSEPLVLSVYHEKKVYNVKIRFIESSSKYVLGTGERSNFMFDSVADIINFHTIYPIILISGRNLPGGKYAENCVLTYAVTRKDINQLLQ